MIHTAKNAVPFSKDVALHIMLCIFFIFFICYAVKPVDDVNWWTENIITGFVLLLFVFMYKRTRLSNFSYVLILIILLLHITGAYFTYALCPLGDLFNRVWDSGRNNYDRFVSLLYGILITIPILETVYREFRFSYKEACAVSCVFLIFTEAIYEIIEMFIAFFLNTQQASIFLAYQGDIWDPQIDMLLSLIGAVISMSTCILFKIKRNHRIHMVKKRNV